ncbi:uncharacterized protein K02A2.6-like [Nilaparvata lugens]|uniref:uncharacterized protein K02A2.6-like n=1 Tax=Nilaparvata lugens TaxID=108931 RepID=UPI00193CB117|nr:uncharacterized protein K02A2.6-like [Nilaparvata lugens]
MAPFDCVATISMSTTNIIDEPEVVQCNQLGEFPVSATDIARETMSDPASKDLYYSIVQGNLKNSEEYTIQDGCILRGNRIYIPSTLRKLILHELHDGHLGTQKMKSVARSYVFWDNIDRDISNITQACPACIRYSKSPDRVIHKWLPPDAPWQRIHVDHAGPFFNKYFLILVDAYSKWIEVFFVPNLSSTSNIPFFRETFARFGMPSVLVSDNHSCFTSAEFQTFLKGNGIRHMATPVKHPASNGQVERYVQTLKAAIRKALFGKPSRDIHQALQIFLLSYRKAPHCRTGTSPAQVMFGRDIRSRLDFMKNVIPPADKPDLQLRIGDTVVFRDHTTADRTWNTGSIISFDGSAIALIQTHYGIMRRHMDQIRKISHGFQDDDDATLDFQDQFNVPAPVTTPAPVMTSPTVPQAPEQLDFSTPDLTSPELTPTSIPPDLTTNIPDLRLPESVPVLPDLDLGSARPRRH